MQVRLLGPVDVTVGGVPRPVSGVRRKAVLAALALQPGQVVSADRLADIVWGGAAAALNTLQSHVSHLRRVLGEPGAIRARPPGYLLDLGPDGTDVQTAERLIHEAAASTDPGRRASRLRDAMALW
ncbi:MAG TPA: helix-turn-helix domain-containing protein, partial [Rugosimonospora sp.]|nr:helix-turn-helix domain-containing protein [Rugosimonospora sp.]